MAWNQIFHEIIKYKNKQDTKEVSSKIGINKRKNGKLSLSFAIDCYVSTAQYLLMADIIEAGGSECLRRPLFKKVDTGRCPDV